MIKYKKKFPFWPGVAWKKPSNCCENALSHSSQIANSFFEFHCRRLALTTLEGLSWTPLRCPSDIPPTAPATTPRQEASASPELPLCTSEGRGICKVRTPKEWIYRFAVTCQMSRLMSSRCQQRAAISFSSVHLNQILLGKYLGSCLCREIRLSLHRLIRILDWSLISFGRQQHQSKCLKNMF